MTRICKNKFHLLGGFPNVIGCIDCTHIPIKSPGGDNGEVFRNRKGWMSLNVQVVGGPNYEIQDIVIRWPGSAHDSRIFDNSSLKIKLEEGLLKGLLIIAWRRRAHADTLLVYTSPQSTNTRRI